MKDIAASPESLAEDLRPILVFDSGIGGLTVLREARLMMPDRQYIYVADDSGFPYGDWEEEALRKRIVMLFGQFIAAYNPAIAVIACNTASTLVLGDLRRAYPSLPFVGTVPAIKPAAERSFSGLVSVLATPGTVKRAYTRELIQSFAKQCHVRLVGADRLASVAEAHIRGEKIDDDLVLKQIMPCFIERDGRRTDIVVLACTHYPFLVNVFRRLAPWPVDWLDPAEAIARRMVSLLPPREGTTELQHSDDIAIFTSQKPDYAIRRLMQGVGLQCLLPSIPAHNFDHSETD